MPNSKKFTQKEIETLKVFHPRLTKRQRFSDLRTRKFGRLLVLEYAGEKSRNKYWFCRCECKLIIKAAGTNLKSGKTTSCGCLVKEARGEESPWHATYQNRKSRPVGEYRSAKGRLIPPFFTKDTYYKPERSFQKDLPAFLYIQTVYKTESVSETNIKIRKYCYKIGISNDWPEKRCREYNQHSLLVHKVYLWWCFENGEIPRFLETAIKKQFQYKPKFMTVGNTESFKLCDLKKVVDHIEKYIHQAGCRHLTFTSTK